MRKPGIPPVPKKVDDRTRFDGAVKESLEIVMGRAKNKSALLDPTTATLDDVVAKVNELLLTLQE